MKLETIMHKIQENDLTLVDIIPEETYEFAVDLNNALKNVGHYSVKYYEKCEELGITYKEATEKLGEYLRGHLVKIEEEDTQ